MANTYTRLYIQTVFAVQDRASLIGSSWKNELYKYISGIIKNNNHKPIAIGGASNHVHILIGYKPHQLISDLLQDIKGSSSKWINQKRFVKGKFKWQAGYGAFSYSHSQLYAVVKYIENQEIHHKKTTFKEEYLKLLERFNIDFNEKFVLNDV